MIQELMIINEAGIALFYYNFINNERLRDKQSLASYFDIICRFTKKSFKESLRTIELDNYKFLFYTHKSHFHLVLKCKNKDFDKKLLESISEKVLDAFLIKYNDILKDFNGEISHFKSFSEDVMNLLAIKFDEFKKYPSLEH
ncbi:MAG: hypothetical protein ACFE91_02110 [Promethearchaeota archaeon]